MDRLDAELHEPGRELGVPMLWGAPLGPGILLALPGAAGMMLLLWRYFPERATAGTADAVPLKD